MQTKVKTTVSNANLIAAVAKSCNYHTYEVEDVLQHLTKCLQKLLSENGAVRLTGLGTIRMQKLKSYEKLNSDLQKVCYDSFRLSVGSDSAMKKYLKGHYEG